VSRKHNCPHRRTPGGYKRRLAARGIGRTPRMRWTGMSTEQITKDFKAIAERDRPSPRLPRNAGDH
jgi:hypothetical protein